MGAWTSDVARGNCHKPTCNAQKHHGYRQNLKNQIVRSGLTQRFRQQQGPYRGSKHGQHLGAALNPAQVAPAEYLTPDGEEHHGYNAARNPHGDAIKDDVRKRAHLWKRYERRSQHAHADSHELLDGPARCQPSTGKVRSQPQHGADHQNEMVRRGVKAPQLQNGLVKQRDAGVYQAEN